MDSIPPGHRIALRVPGTTSVPRHHAGTAQANLLTQITALIETYNARLRRMSLTQRASNNLTSLHLHAKHNGSVTIVHHDSFAWASGIVPTAPAAPGRVRDDRWAARPINPASRSELRAYFLRKGGSKRDAWARFPPGDASERAQMERDLGAPKRASDPMDKIIAAAARKRKRDPNDPAFRALIREEQAELQRILDEVMI